MSPCDWHYRTFATTPESVSNHLRNHATHRTMTAMNTTPTSDAPDMTAVLGDEDRCAERLAPIWRAADVLPFYPVPTATVVELLRAGAGLDVSVELLEGWIRSGMVPDCKLRQGRFAWTATNILTAAIQADTWRRWIALDPRHLSKLTAVELAESQANAAGSTVFSDLGTFDVNAFIQVLSRCNDPDVRHTFAVALKSKLRSVAPGVLDQ